MDPTVALNQHMFLQNPLPSLELNRPFILGQEIKSGMMHWGIALWSSSIQSHLNRLEGIHRTLMVLKANVGISFGIR